MFTWKVQDKTSSNICIENLFDGYDCDWTAICMLPHLVTYNTHMQSFQYKIVNNVLFINKKTLYFWNKSSLL